MENNDDSYESGSSSSSSSLKKKSERKGEMHHCTDCGFRSDRRFNVIRHYDRLHEPTEKIIECCDEIFLTKGQYYRHSVDFHPERRKSATILKTKYKLFGKRSKYHSRKSWRIPRSREINNNGLNNHRDFEIDENKPLIHYLNNSYGVNKNSMKNKLKISRKYQDYQKIEINCNRVKIFFNVDVTSRFYSKIQYEFLKNIDFEHFKLI